MENTNNNVRTLVISFVVAVMALIPLRFIEVGQQLGMSVPEKMVLGESCVSQEEIDLSWNNLRTEVENGQVGNDQVSERVEKIMELEGKRCFNGQ